MNFTEKDGVVLFDVRVVPRSSRSEIVGEHDGALKIRLASPPVDGAANAELPQLLAKSFGVAKAQIEIVSGLTSKVKRISISGATPAAITAILKGNSQRDIFSTSVSQRRKHDR